MAVIKKVGDGAKRLCAVLVACVVMWYSVITAPVFRVHGAFFDFPFSVSLNGLVDWAYETTRSRLEVLPGDIGTVPLYLLDSVYAVFGSDGMADQAVDLYNDITNSGNSVVIDTATSTGWSGYYERNGSVHSVSMFTRDVSSYDASKNIMLISTDDYFLSLKILPTSGHGYEDYTFTLTMSVGGGGYGPSYGSFAYKLTSQNTSMTFIPQLTLYSYGDTLTKTYSNGVYQFEQWVFVSTSSSPYVLPDDPSSLIDHLSPSSITSSGTIRNQTFICSFNQRYPGNQPARSWPIGNTQTLSYDNFENTYNYYNQYVTPTIQQQVGDTFTVYDVDYYSEIVQENQPSETTSPGTGVIIIDPFTLPPEWVESDVVELETDHYEVPFESMVADPFDYLVSPYTQTSTETVRGALKTVPISPPTPQYQVFPSSGNVQETAVGFVNLAYTLLNRSGLDYVIGIAVFGLCVSLLVL